MVPEPLTLDAWRARLECQGHQFIEPEYKTATGFTLWPDASVEIVTVATAPDDTQYPQCRERFLLCAPEPEQIFRDTNCPEVHRGRWLELVSRQLPGYWQDFMAGPGAWLLSRLARFQRVVAWADRGLPWDWLDDSGYRESMYVPAAAAPFFAPTAGPEASRPRLVAVSDARFTDVVAVCILFASVGLRDCYLADETGTEVYLAHHHDKVVSSIPNVEARDGLLRQVADVPWLFSDVSGDLSSRDENGGEDRSEVADP